MRTEKIAGASFLGEHFMNGRLEGQGVLITGGSGTFARAFIPHCLREGARRIVAFARHEVEMAHLEADFGPGDRDQLRYFIGDVRDLHRLRRAMQDIDVVVHAAALKRIEQCERDPFEAVATNVVGSMTVISACLDTSVKRCLLLSSDKAVAPVSLYGATKMCAERLFLAANNMAGGRCVFGAVRYGNIWASRGSVIHQWLAAIAAEKPLLVTDPDATRFFMRTEEAVDLVQRTLDRLKTGPTAGVAFPSLPAYRLDDLCHALDYGYSRTVGLPPFEKAHETLNGIVYSDNVRRLTVQELRDEIAKLRATA